MLNVKRIEKLIVISITNLTKSKNIKWMVKKISFTLPLITNSYNYNLYPELLQDTIFCFYCKN